MFVGVKQLQEPVVLQQIWPSAATALAAKHSPLGEANRGCGTHTCPSRQSASESHGQGSSCAVAARHAASAALTAHPTPIRTRRTIRPLAR